MMDVTPRMIQRWWDFLRYCGATVEIPPSVDLATGVFSPTFQLPRCHLFVRVTNAEPHEGLLRACEAFRWATGAAILLAVGEPGGNRNRLFAWDVDDNGGGIADLEDVEILATPSGALVFAVEDPCCHRSYWCDAAMTHELRVVKHVGGWATMEHEGHEFECPIQFLRSQGRDVLLAALAGVRGSA